MFGLEFDFRHQRQSTTKTKSMRELLHFCCRSGNMPQPSDEIDWSPFGVPPEPTSDEIKTLKNELYNLFPTGTRVACGKKFVPQADLDNMTGDMLVQYSTATNYTYEHFDIEDDEGGVVELKTSPMAEPSVIKDIFAKVKHLPTDYNCGLHLHVGNNFNKFEKLQLLAAINEEPYLSHHYRPYHVWAKPKGYVEKYLIDKLGFGHCPKSSFLSTLTYMTKTVGCNINTGIETVEFRYLTTNNLSQQTYDSIVELIDFTNNFKTTNRAEFPSLIVEEHENSYHLFQS